MHMRICTDSSETALLEKAIRIKFLSHIKIQAFYTCMTFYHMKILHNAQSSIVSLSDTKMNTKLYLV